MKKNNTPSERLVSTYAFMNTTISHYLEAGGFPFARARTTPESQERSDVFNETYAKLIEQTDLEPGLAERVANIALATIENHQVAEGPTTTTDGEKTSSDTEMQDTGLVDCASIADLIEPVTMGLSHDYSKKWVTEKKIALIERLLRSDYMVNRPNGTKTQAAWEKSMAIDVVDRIFAMLSAPGAKVLGSLISEIIDMPDKAGINMRQVLLSKARLHRRCASISQFFKEAMWAPDIASDRTDFAIQSVLIAFSAARQHEAFLGLVKDIRMRDPDVMAVVRSVQPPTVNASDSEKAVAYLAFASGKSIKAYKDHLALCAVFNFISKHWPYMMFMIDEKARKQ
jgi:hypothetical protein